MRFTCPSSSSRPPCLLFLGLSLCIFRATIVRGCLAKSSDALQSTCQLQQQGDELEKERERVRGGQCQENTSAQEDTGASHVSTPPSSARPSLRFKTKLRPLHREDQQGPATEVLGKMSQEVCGLERRPRV